jgi:membrane protein required for beta-lactamase induction
VGAYQIKICPKFASTNRIQTHENALFYNILILFVWVTHIGIFLGPYDVHPEVTTYVDVPI